MLPYFNEHLWYHHQQFRQDVRFELFKHQLHLVTLYSMVYTGLNKANPQLHAAVCNVMQESSAAA